MGDVLFQGLQVIRRQRARRRAIPIGYGLLLGVSISLGLWGLIIWAVIKAFD
jgi:hypothetical protein